MKPILLENLYIKVNKNNLDQKLRYNDGGNVHMDFHGATNTTIDKNILKSKKFYNFKGGVSGKPLINKSNKIIEQLYDLLNKKITIIGVGGITSPSAAKNKIRSGAELLQLYTGLVYSGTTLIKEICEEMK